MQHDNPIGLVMAAELWVCIHTCPLVQLWALKRAWTHNCTCSFECDCCVCEIKGEPYRDPLQKVWLQAESPTMSDSVLMVLLLPLYPIVLPFIRPSSSSPHPSPSRFIHINTPLYIPQFQKLLKALISGYFHTNNVNKKCEIFSEISVLKLHFTGIFIGFLVWKMSLHIK